MIRFACPSCGAVFTAGDERGGKTGSCSKCQAQFIIPEAVAPPPKPAAKPAAPPERPQVPVHVPPRTAAQPKQPAPVAKVVRDEAPAKPRPKLDLGEDEDDDRPRRRSSRNEDDDDDAPRRRPSSRRDDDEVDDRPRRRGRDRNDDEDYDRPRRKAPKQHGLAIAAGIVLIVFALLMGSIGAVDASDMPSSPRSSSGDGDLRFRNTIPPELKNAVDNLENALLCFKIFAYGSILGAVAFLAGGIGLVLHQHWGRFTCMGGAGLCLIMIIALTAALLFLNAITGGSGRSAPSMGTGTTMKFVLRYLMHIVPVIMTAVTVFRFDVIKKFR